MNIKLNQKSDILEQIFTQLKTHFPLREQSLIQNFINAIYRDVSIIDLTTMSPDDLAGLTVSIWREVHQWKGEIAKVKVFNPDVEQDEWQSAHTIISVLSRNIPFVIDTLKIILNKQNIKLHRIFYSEICSERNAAGKLKKLNEDNDTELLLYIEIDQTSSATERLNIQKSLQKALLDVSLVVDDYQQMISKVDEAIKVSAKGTWDMLTKEHLIEQQTYLSWMKDDHFTFLACDQFTVKDNTISIIKGSQLGLLKHQDFMNHKTQFDCLSELQQPSLIHFSKASQRAMVHRIAYPDVIYIKQFNKQGQLIGGIRFIGLYTSSVYSGSPLGIPVIRQKINHVLAESGLSFGGHYYKELTQILSTYAVEDLLLCDEKTLLNNVLEVLHAQERKELKLFLRTDGNKRFVTALLYVPRDVYNTEVRLKFAELLSRTMPIADSDFQTYLSESNLARLRLVIHLDKPYQGELEVDAIQLRMQQIIKAWHEELQDSLVEHYGEAKGVKLIRKYQVAFPSSYQESFSSRVAVADIERIESLFSLDNHSMRLHFYRSLEANNSELKLKLFHQHGALLLSDLIPILENLGLKVAQEYPYQVSPFGEEAFWLYDFTLLYIDHNEFDPEHYSHLLADAFLGTWYNKVDNDPFNKLILGAGIGWRDIAMLRAYAKYLKQIRFGFSHFAIARTLLDHCDLVKKIVALFHARFNPEKCVSLEQQAELENKILESLNAVSNLNEDRVLRKYVELIMATLRTNYFQNTDAVVGEYKDYISFKFDHKKIGDIPLPRLSYEVFVYSPRFEGVHLRGGNVARGGLRWSDRGEDYRTEVLGLVKAQQVKNSVIVPVGAKGGFVAKELTAAMDRDAFMQEGIACYKMFISALLDITDNLENETLLPPSQVVRYDNDDPYLVVAADKGTATFSDIANELATDRKFWLKDAFASGGSNGYDHKKMGITAKGAWISVQRHFRELGVDVQEEPISVIGIGDMAGDVFGNGMLCSNKIKLLAAFNHLHIFIDPNPTQLDDCFNERQRLFDTPRTSWSDYNQQLISAGGGIFERSAKSIVVSPEMAKTFNIKQAKVTPTELISFLLKSPVDLLWNGGIGTYVKSEQESHADVGDKANDTLRVNGSELRCKVIGEGGNLGMTQSARIEYSLLGGKCFTDAIDNAAGVNCSDLEVNIKILLDKLVSKGDLTVKQRNVWLQKMTGEVSALVLHNNYRQAQSISLSFKHGHKRIEEFRGLIDNQEEKGKLNRALEFIPTDETITDRKNAGVGLMRPAISVMLSYAKNEMKEELAKAKIAEDTYLAKEAEKIFPAELVKSYKNEIHEHPLLSEIVATQVSNDLFNVMGATFAYRIMSSTGCSFLDLAKAWVVARDIFELPELLAEIESLDNKIDSAVQAELIYKLMRMVRHASRWIIRNDRGQMDCASLIKKYKSPLHTVKSNLLTLLSEQNLQQRKQELSAVQKQGVPESLAERLSSTKQSYALLNIIAVANKLKVDAQLAARVYFYSEEQLKLTDIAMQLNLLPVDSHWQSLAREAMRDDLEWQQKRITKAVLLMLKDNNVEQAYSNWQTQHQSLAIRWHKMADALSAISVPEFSMCQVALRELLDLSKS
ncbi:NAD-glutamate dehydrogenase [Psychromonas sp. RZ22]|uniref:NAD-glutamate dehydrogenase n=1 Tax=Psychromonas algarum TaxID=2555643 RepID=UPI0010681F43|nr:NAD-glutamate dehydrogenase [Psychromonas sp. RZ22]TEW54456.1 NAD-glutamate dehydrogenase [Psychromonas sp. RZ22]